ncbi:aldo/keto reductase [Roseitalea porphyridii]|uniref:Aldo/keto reductase n=1 Tax=Roseitalea porphyridii TaxID=1852022 RepID=A0A4P6UYB1_9HYPH|nr:aldo/keto reductase [Roseitalea porphyridii]QBK29294.1 aldo/keto reductase [Roseitalea porphyridii]
MKMRKLGRTGLDVSELCLGTMTWGSQNSEEEAHEQMSYALEAGINFFDTAEMYPTTPFRTETAGRTEEIIGTWLAEGGRRDKIVLATKVLGPGGHGVDEGRPIDAEKMRKACERSLKRLQTDHIDLYQIHWPNRGSYHFRQTWTYAPEKQDTAKALDDVAEILETADALVREGKIGHFGLSNETVWGTAQYLRLAEAKGWPRVQSIQNEYSLLHRIFDTDFAELSHHEDVGLLSYSSLAAGLLSGKYEDGKIPEGSRRSINESMGGRMTDYLEPALGQYLDVARKHGLDPAQMALAFCLTRPFLTSVIIGATSMDQLKTCIDAAAVTLDDAVLEDIAQVHRRWPIPM